MANLRIRDRIINCFSGYCQQYISFTSQYIIKLGTKVTLYENDYITITTSMEIIYIMFSIANFQSSTIFTKCTIFILYAVILFIIE